MEAKRFEEALENLIKAKIIYQKISEYKDTIEAIIYQERVQQIDTLIRLCCFQLNGMTDKAKEDAFIAKSLKSFGSKEKLEGEIARIKSETQKEMIQNIEEVTFNGKSIPLKTEKIKEVFKRFHLMLHDI
jgi:hypothetical protein